MRHKDGTVVSSRSCLVTMQRDRSEVIRRWPERLKGMAFTRVARSHSSKSVAHRAALPFLADERRLVLEKSSHIPTDPQEDHRKERKGEDTSEGQKEAKVWRGQPSLHSSQLTQFSYVF